MAFNLKNLFIKERLKLAWLKFLCLPYRAKTAIVGVLAAILFFIVYSLAYGTPALISVILFFSGIMNFLVFIILAALAAVVGFGIIFTIIGEMPY